MEERIIVLKHSQSRFYEVTDRKMLDKWMKDGSIEDGDQILICKDYTLQRVESQTKLKLVKM